MVNRKDPPPTRIIEELPHIGVREAVLGNGLPVYLLEGGSEDVLKAELVFSAGSYYQPAPLVCFSTASLLKTGTVNHQAGEISRILDFYGTHYQEVAQKDLVSLSVFVLQKHLDPVLDLFQEMVKNPVFSEEEMRLFLKNQKQRHLVNNQKVQYMARNFFNELLYGSQHPYGHHLKAEDFDQVERQALADFHKEYFHPGNAYCLVSGRLPANILDLLEDKLGGSDWPAREVDTPPHYVAWAASEKKVLVEKPGALQSAIRIGRRLFNRTHPDYHRLMITNALLGGFFGSRLMQNIRQDKGYTYGIGSNLVSLLRDGYFFISTEVGVNVCQQAIEEIGMELKKLRTIPATADELSNLKSYLAGNFLRSFDGPFAQSERLKEILAFQMDVSHYQAFLHELNAITAGQIMQIAEKYLHEDSMIELVVGKKQ
ncbi:MAG: pitrilysin family protein [Bacteroidales bacterium]